MLGFNGAVDRRRRIGPALERIAVRGLRFNGAVDRRRRIGDYSSLVAYMISQLQWGRRSSSTDRVRAIYIIISSSYISGFEHPGVHVTRTSAADAARLTCINNLSTLSWRAVSLPHAAPDRSQDRQGRNKFNYYVSRDDDSQLTASTRADSPSKTRWKPHIRQNAVTGARGGMVHDTGPAGAVLDGEREP